MVQTPIQAKAESQSTTVDTLQIAAIERSSDIQVRMELDQEVIQDYAAQMQGGAEFPPVIVFFDGAKYWLADGFHRCIAAELAGLEQIPVEIRLGTAREALLFSVGANATHGLRRSNADKRRAVEILLRDPEWRIWSDRQIARAANVSAPFVGDIRAALYPNESQSVRRTGSGTVIDTAKIGKHYKHYQYPGDLPQAPGSELLEGTKPLTNYQNLESTEEKRIERIEAPGSILTPGVVGETPGIEPAAGSQRTKGTPGIEPAAGRQRTKKRPENLPSVDRQGSIAPPNQAWHLGKHILYCGELSDSQFLKTLPSHLALFLSFPPSADLPTKEMNKAPKTQSGLIFYSSFSAELHLGTLRSIIQEAVEGTTDGGDSILLYYLPDPALFLLFEELDTPCFCAEPDPEKCSSAISVWQTVKHSKAQLAELRI